MLASVAPCKRRIAYTLRKKAHAMTEVITLPWATLLATIPIMIFAGLVHGALGLGFPLIATPLIALFVDVRIAIVITLLPTAVVNLVSITSHGSIQSVAVKYMPLALASFLGSLLGTAVLAVTDAEIFRLLLALLILCFLWTQTQDKLPTRWLQIDRTVLLIIVGLMAGFAGGTTNVMVAILLIYFLAAAVARAEMVAALNLCFLVGKISQIAVFFITGLVSFVLLLKTLPLAACALGSLIIGQRLGSRIPQERYKRWLMYLLAILATILIAQFTSQVI